MGDDGLAPGVCKLKELLVTEVCKGRALANLVVAQERSRSAIAERLTPLREAASGAREELTLLRRSFLIATEDAFEMIRSGILATCVTSQRAGREAGCVAKMECAAAVKRDSGERCLAAPAAEEIKKLTESQGLQADRVRQHGHTLRAAAREMRAEVQGLRDAAARDHDEVARLIAEAKVKVALAVGGSGAVASAPRAAEPGRRGPQTRCADRGRELRMQFRDLGTFIAEEVEVVGNLLALVDRSVAALREATASSVREQADARVRLAIEVEHYKKVVSDLHDENFALSAENLRLKGCPVDQDRIGGTAGQPPPAPPAAFSPSRPPDAERSPGRHPPSLSSISASPRASIAPPSPQTASSREGSSARGSVSSKGGSSGDSEAELDDDLLFRRCAPPPPRAEPTPLEPDPASLVGRRVCKEFPLASGRGGVRLVGTVAGATVPASARAEYRVVYEDGAEEAVPYTRLRRLLFPAGIPQDLSLMRPGDLVALWNGSPPGAPFRFDLGEARAVAPSGVSVAPLRRSLHSPGAAEYGASARGGGERTVPLSLQSILTFFPPSHLANRSPPPTSPARPARNPPLQGGLSAPPRRRIPEDGPVGPTVQMLVSAGAMAVPRPGGTGSGTPSTVKKAPASKRPRTHG